MTRRTEAKGRNLIKGRTLSLGARTKTLPIKWTLSVGLAVCLLIYILRLDAVAGELIDDAWYILLAKALATGHGFTVINAPAPLVTHFYPHPAFVALLSLVFRIAPHFPANVFLMKTISIVAIMLAGWFTYRYFAVVKETAPHFAAGITVATLLTPAIVFLATSTVMSECVFIFLQTATIVLVERSLRANSRKRDWFMVLAAAVLAGIAFLTRPIGIGLLAAAVIYLFITKRLLKALGFSILVSFIVIPWLVYSHHVPQESPINDPRFPAQPYTSVFAKKLPQFVESDVGGILLPSLYRTPSESGLEVLGMQPRLGMDPYTIFISLVLSGLCLWGFIVTTRRSLGMAEITVFLSLLMILFGSVGASFRYLLPLAPFFIFYALEGIIGLRGISRRRVIRSSLKDGLRWERVGTIFLLLIISLNLYDHAAYLLCKFHLTKARIGWIDRSEESKQLLQWVSANIDPATVVATENAPLVNLYTGLKTLPDLDPVNDKDELRRKGAKLFVHISPYFASSVLLDDPRFHVLYYTKESNFYVLSLDP